jgi:Family of unknown function (DUF6163)
MSDPRTIGRRQPIDPDQPVHARGDEGAPADLWAQRLVTFLRAMAGVSMLKGLYHWTIVCGIDAPTPGGFADYPTPYQSATAFFAVIDLVAAVGLWLAAPWGAVVWLTSIISMIAVEMLFPQIYGGRILLVIVEFAWLGTYLVLALRAAREQPI